ncbi:hypothetical protein M011DRAFT_120209 [Sporormia fimetaria CBS 119925]|uniref:Secreted protein n=1 Tax=Sporormia fimetaria CBS 119925 TaxID=1340428 RepID=A0A6A6V7W1_9PLEO|nr:hypothetical protein M011DRAFT_120209 [Sporormia fimetaria CBS 119925]
MLSYLLDLYSWVVVLLSVSCRCSHELAGKWGGYGPCGSVNASTARPGARKSRLWTRALRASSPASGDGLLSPQRTRPDERNPTNATRRTQPDERNPTKMLDERILININSADAREVERLSRTASNELTTRRPDGAERLHTSRTRKPVVSRPNTAPRTLLPFFRTRFLAPVLSIPRSATRAVAFAMAFSA